MSPNKKYIFLGLGISSLVISVVMGIVLYNKHGPHVPLSTVPPEIAASFIITPQPTIEPSPTPTPLKTFDSPKVDPTSPTEEVPILTPAPTQEWMVYDGIDLREQQVEILVSLNCDDQEVYIQQFTVIPWHPEVFTNGQFAVTSNNAVAWEHLGFYGLWVHSGQDIIGNELTAYPLQNALERNEAGILHDPTSFDKALDSCLISSEISIKQGDTISLNQVVAAVRVPSEKVEEVSSHVMDLLPYLAETYPDSGFDQMTSPGMLLYFCGRRLNGESYNVNENYWTQSRIIIGFQPSTTSD